MGWNILEDDTQKPSSNRHIPDQKTPPVSGRGQRVIDNPPPAGWTLPVPALEASMRWFGPADPVPLAYLRQAGASAVFTSLHDIPYGEAWSRGAVRERREMIEAAGLRWTAVESIPVHEDLKTGRGDLGRLLESYAASLRAVAAEGIRTVIYNFMPVLDWVRTSMAFVLPDGSRSMRFDPVHFAAFDLHALRRPGAEHDHPPEIREKSAAWWRTLDEPERERFIASIIDVFPGVKWGLTLDDIRAMLARYQGIVESQLLAHLERFLQHILPVAEELGLKLAIHPDDPPFPVLGLPRIVSTGPQLDAILALADSPSHGLCFCTGSLGARADNDLPALVARFADRIHALHLRSTTLEPGGAFHEAGHLEGSTDLLDVLRSYQNSRTSSDSIPWRPDHGLVIMDDLAKPEGITPGYSAIGRLKGLAEIRGMLRALA